MPVEIVMTPERCEEIIEELEAVSRVQAVQAVPVVQARDKVSMILPPNSNLVHTKAMLERELVTVHNVEATIQRCIEIVDSMIVTGAREGIRRTGVAIFVGGGLEHVFNVSAVPFNTSMYLVDRRFHTHAIPRL